MSITRTAGSAPAGNRAEPEGRDDGRLAGILARWIVATLARDGFGRRADLREDCLLEAEVAVWRAETHDPPKEGKASSSGRTWSFATLLVGPTLALTGGGLP